MIPSLLSSLAWALASLGLGSTLGYKGDPALRPALSGLLGLGVLAILATSLNFLVPLSALVSAVSLVAGIALFFGRRHWLLAGAARLDVAILAGLFCVLPLLQQPPDSIYDGGLYHLQTLQWMERSALVRGLGNLHYRLAFNSGWHGAAALLEHPFARGRSIFFLNVLPVGFAVAAATVGLRRMVGGDATFGNTLLATALFPAAAVFRGIGTLTPDCPVTLFVYLAITFWAKAFEAKGENFHCEAATATLLSAIACILKTSAILLPAGAALLLLSRTSLLRRHGVAWPLAFAGIGLATWTLRSLLLSGCLVMPATATCIPGLTWGIPVADVAVAAAWIKSWARLPGPPPDRVLANWDWFSSWLVQTRGMLECKLIVALGAVGSIVWAAFVRRISASLLVAVTLALAGSAFWFFAAPDVRFGLGYLYALGIIPISFAMSRLHERHPGTFARTATAIAIVATSAWFTAACGAWGTATNRFRHVPLLTWPAVPSGDTVERVTATGLKVRVPRHGDQCWSAPAPCTPETELARAIAWDNGFVALPAARSSQASKAP